MSPSTTASVLLFGDGTVDPVPCLKQLTQDAKRSVSLDAFLRITASSLRSELANATSPYKNKYPVFDSIIGLAEWHASLEQPQVVVFPVLLCVAQIGVLLREYELNPTILDASEGAPLYSVGLCNGMLAAACAAACKSAADLLTVGPKVVCLNLRLMLASLDRSKSIDTSDDTWTILTPGVTAKQHESMIGEFVTSNLLPRARYPYVSAQSGTGSTISGPPSSIAKYFTSSDLLRNAKKVATSLNGAYHAPHLWSPDLNLVLGNDKIWKTYSVREDVRLFSINTGELIKASDLASLLLHCMDEVMNKRFRWDNLLKALSQNIGSSSCTHASIFPVGPDRVSTAVETSITDAGVQATIAEPTSATTAILPPSADDIAIIGISTRLPDAETLDEAWTILKEGRDTHSRVPVDRFNLEDHFDPDGRRANTTVSPYGCFIKNPGAFDARMFNMSPREASQTDPMQRLALLTTYEALEMAGYSPDTLPSFSSERIATFWGQTVDDYRETNACQNVDIYYVSGGVRAFTPGRLNYHFKWEGPSMSVDTACSSSALAVQLAFQSLRSGECDMAVAGGGNVLSGADMYAGLSRGGFLSKTGNCKTFSEEADGYCRGEGVGSVVLKRLQDALDDGDNILATIKSCSTNHSAHAESITRPHSETQMKVMRQALREACLEPSDIDYVEMHGTGTQAGDTAEFSSIAHIFVPGRNKQHPLHVGSVKANVGHGEAAAGLSSLAKAVLMLRHDAIPPCVGIKNEINPRFRQADLQVISIDRNLQPFPKQGHRPRRILLNSFNAAGGNTAIILEDAPPLAPTSKPSSCRQAHVVVISGRTRKSFVGNRRNLLSYLQENPHPQLADLSYTTTARRMHHAIRASYIAEDVSELIETLKQHVDIDKVPPASSSSSRKVVFVFAGQGSHTLDMARQLALAHAPFKQKLEEYDHVCQNQDLPCFLDRLLEEDTSSSLTPAESQISIVAIQLALAALLRTWGFSPQAVIGHSIGEYAALATAGVLNESDVLYLAGERARAIEELCKPGESGMLSIVSDLKTIEAKISSLSLDGCVIACHNGPSSFVVSGPAEKLSRLATQLSESKIVHKAVDVAFGFHSAQMMQVGGKLGALAKNMTFNEPEIPVASTLLGKVVSGSGTFNGDYLNSQTVQPVKFSKAVSALSKHLGKLEETLWQEVGSHPTCGPMIVSNLRVPGKQVMYMLRRNENPWHSISKSLATAYELGVAINWTEFHRDQLPSLTLLDLPHYAFDLENHWIPYCHSWRLDKGPRTHVKSVASVIDPKLAPFHRLEHEKITKNNVKLCLACDMSEPKLSAVIAGHFVEGVALCPSSVYADLTYNAAAHVLGKTPVGSHNLPSLALGAMEIISPLTLPSSGGRSKILLVHAEWVTKEPQTVTVMFTTANGSQETKHCQCTVLTGKSSQWAAGWQENEYLIQSQIDALEEGNKRPVHLIYQDMIYNLFGAAIVKYSREFQLIRRIRVDYERNEAVADMGIPDRIESKNGSPGPFLLDALMHMAGFILNSNPHFSPDSSFIASGWKILQLAEAFCAGKVYSIYSRMFAAKDSNVFIGNVHVLCGERIVGVCRGLKFHQLRRSSLHKLIGTSSGSSAVAVTAKQAKPIPVKVTRSVKSLSAAKSQPAVSKEGAMISTEGVLDDIAAETGVIPSDLFDSTKLSELGIDSLLSISLLDRFKERTGSSLPVDTFSVCATIGALKEFLQMKLQAQIVQPSAEEALEEVDRSLERARNQSVAASSISGETLDGEEADGETDSSSKSQQLFAIIAAEIGTNPEEVMAARTVGELGIDSLLMVSITSEFSDQTGEDLGPRFFYDHSTITAIIQKLDGSLPPKVTDEAAVTDDVESDSSLSPAASDEDGTFLPDSFPRANTPGTPPTPPFPTDLGRHKCVSMLLQGKPTDGEAALFMLPDGSGSLFSYIHLPESKPGMAVYGFDSPFHKNPDDWNLSFTEVAKIYVREIRRLQPSGPYMIGGWSLGGVHAFEVTRQLLEIGERVDRLVLMDSPCPGTLPPLPHASLDLLEKAGIFKGLSKEVGKVAQHTRTHFVKITDAFQHWDHRPLTDDERSRLGSVTVIWAQHGVLENDDDARNAWVPGMDKVDADMLKAKEWLTGKRKSFDAEGWDKLVGKEIRCMKVPGNHFSMMFPPVVSEFSRIFKEIL